MLKSNAGAIATAKQILAGLPAADADYAGMHWYEADRTTFSEAMALLRLLSGCNSIASDRLGGRSPSATEVTWKLQDSEDGGLRLVVWDAPAPPDPSSLTNTGGFLTANGLAVAAATRTADCD